MSSRVVTFICLMAIAPVFGAVDASRPSIRIAYVGGLTGGGSQSAIKSLKAVRLAAKEANDHGGVLGRRIEVVEYDDHTAAADNIPVFRKILADHATAIVGVHYSNDGLILAEQAEKHGVPLVVASATHPGITKDKTFVVRVCFTDDRQGQALANLAFRRMNARRIATVVDVSNSFTDYLAKAFEARLSELGGQVVRTFPIRTDEKDFRDITTEIKRLQGMDAIFIATAAMEAGFFTTQLISAGVSVPILGNDGWQNDNLGQVLHNLQNTLFDAMFTVHWHTEFGTPRSKDFMRSFERAYGERINSFDADPVLSYDAMSLLIAAIGSAKTLDGRAIVKAAREIRFEGVTGPIRIGPTGDPEKRVDVLKISKGKLVRVPVGEI